VPIHHILGLAFIARVLAILMRVWKAIPWTAVAIRGESGPVHIGEFPLRCALLVTAGCESSERKPKGSALLTHIGRIGLGDGSMGRRDADAFAATGVSAGPTGPSFCAGFARAIGPDGRLRVATVDAELRSAVMPGSSHGHVLPGGAKVAAGQPWYSPLDWTLRLLRAGAGRAETGLS
jgi:hypothetical protein